jgi:hypothetical protein
MGHKLLEKLLRTHHAMTFEFRVRMQNAIRRGVISRRVHSIRTCLVKRRLHVRVSFIPTLGPSRHHLTGNRTSLVSAPVIVTIAYVQGLFV